MSELDELPGARVGLVGEFAVEPVADLAAVAQGAVADAQGVLVAGEEVGDQLVDRRRPRGTTCCTPPGTARYMA